MNESATFSSSRKINNALTELVSQLSGYQGANIRLKDVLEYEAGIKITSAEAKRLIKTRSAK